MHVSMAYFLVIGFWNSERELFNKREWLGCPWKAAHMSNLRGKILKLLYLPVKFVKKNKNWSQILLYINEFVKKKYWIDFPLTTFLSDEALQHSTTCYFQKRFPHAREWMFNSHSHTPLGFFTHQVSAVLFLTHVLGCSNFYCSISLMSAY